MKFLCVPSLWLAMERSTETSVARRAEDLPVSVKSFFSGGLVHHIDTTTASVKLTGHYLRDLSDTESDFTSSEEEEKDYTITEIDLNKEVSSLSGLEDTEPLSDKEDNPSVSVTTSSRNKEQLNSSSPRSDTQTKKTVEVSQQNSKLKKIFSEVRFNPFDRDLHMEEDHYTEVVKPDVSVQGYKRKSSNGMFIDREVRQMCIKND